MLLTQVCCHSRGHAVSDLVAPHRAHGTGASRLLRFRQTPVVRTVKKLP